MDIENIKLKFPIFQNNSELVYLDNAATSQKPSRVINAIKNYYETINSNVHRGLYQLAEKSTSAFEDARKNIAKAINADPEEIVFTSGCTESINLLAHSLKKSGVVSNKPRILLSDLEHHSNTLPWMDITDATNIMYLPVDGDYSVDISKGIDQVPDIVSLSLVSNVTGAILDARKASEMYVSDNTIFILDVAQAVGHIKVDVKELGADAVAFSAHKMYGPMGFGVLYVKSELLAKLTSAKTGGGSVKSVKRDSSEMKAGLSGFESGTPNVAGAVGLSEAINFINEIGIENISVHERHLRNYAVEKLGEINGLNIIHPSIDRNATGVISMYHESVHPHDIAQFLGNSNICIRAGHHCAHILHRDVLNIPASFRVSLGIYNTEGDIDRLVKILTQSIETFNH
jgi:cysteine desulfurase/selenocysteine lyase